MSKSSLQHIAQVFLSVETQRDMEEFLQGILTSKEIEEIGRRLAIVQMLKKGVSQHDIAKQLGVGIATVTRGSKELQQGRFKHI